MGRGRCSVFARERRALLAAVQIMNHVLLHLASSGCSNVQANSSKSESDL
jgi:hypothetical protein